MSSAFSVINEICFEGFNLMFAKIGKICLNDMMTSVQT